MSTLTTQELQQQYIAYFGRPGDPTGIDYWLNESDIKTAKEFALKISAQDEYSKGIGSEPVADQVNALYVNLFGRTADADGLIYWTNQVTKGVLSLGNLAYDLIVAAGNPVEGNEGQAALDASALTKKTAAAQIFTDNVKAGGFILDYDNEAAFTVARTFVSNVKADTQLTLEQLTTATQGQVVAMSNASKASPASGSTVADSLSIVEQAQLQAAQAQTAAAQAELAVASQAASDAAVAKAEAAAAAEAAKNAPTSYKLTKTTDTLAGEGGDDTFSGVIQAGTADGTTAFPGDSIDGGDGTDSLMISVAGINPLSAADANQSYTLSAVALDSVEKVTISNFEAADLAGANPSFNIFDAGLWNGVNTVGVNASSDEGDTQFTLLKNFVDAELRNGSGDLTIDYNGQQSKAGLEDVQNLTVSSTTAGTFIANGIETINVTTELNKSVLTDIESDRLGKLTISGDQNLTVNNSAGGLVFYNPQGGAAIDGTVDAAAATGDIVINVGGSAATVSATGGTGDDTFNFLGTLEKNDVVDGGEGSNMVTMDRQAEAITTEFANVTNISKFGVNPAVANTSIDVSKLPSSVTTIQFDLKDGAINAGAGGSTIDATATKVLDGTTFVLKKTAFDAADFDAADGTTLSIEELNDTTSNTVDIVLDAIGKRTAPTGGGYSTIAAGNYETIGLESKRNKDGTITDNEVALVTATSAADITVTGNADLTIGSLTGSKLKTFDATALTGKLVLTSTAGASSGTTFKTPNSQTTLNLGTTLNGYDNLIGGTNGKDEVTAAPTTAFTTATGKLKISGIETIDLDTTTANKIDLSGVTGAKSFEVAAGVQTITGFDLSSGLVLKADDDTSSTTVADATFKITPTDTSGTEDSITLARTLGNANDGLNVVDLSGVETLNLVLEDTDDGAIGTSVWNLAKFAGNSIVVTEGVNDTQNVKVNLGTLHKNITSVDTSAMDNEQTAVASATALAGVDFKGSGDAIATFTGTEWNDSFTIGKTAGVTHILNGGQAGTAANANGVDTATVTITTNFINPSTMAVEVLNLDVDPGKDIQIGAAGFNAATTTINIVGGNSLSAFENDFTGGAEFPGTVEIVDASTYGGFVQLEFEDNSLDSTVTVTGTGGSTDDVFAKYTTADANFKPKVTDIYELNLETALGGSNTTTVNLGDTSGTSKITANLAAADELVVEKVTTENFKLIGGLTTANLNIQLADDSASTDSITIELLANAGTGSVSAQANAIADNATITTSDIETVTIKSSGPAAGETIGLALSMDAASKTVELKVTGGDPLSINALDVDVATIDASGMSDGGSFMQIAGGRSRTKASTYTGSDGNDAFTMSNKDDVLDGGAHTSGTTGDRLTLDNNMELLIGGVEVDLSKSDNVLLTFNGVSAQSSQSNFESIDLSNVVANGYGSIITAATTGSYMSGLDSAVTSRDIILGDAGDDVLQGNAGADRLTPGAGNNTIVFTGTGELSGAGAARDNYIPTLTANDTFQIAEDTNFGGAAGLIVVASGVAGATGVTQIVGLDGITVLEGKTATFDDLQLNGLTNVVVSGDATAGGVETLVVALDDGNDSINLSGFTGESTPVTNNFAVTITGGTGNDTITGVGAGLLETITPNAGNDTVTLGTASTRETVVVGQVGSSTAANIATALENPVARTDTITFANGLDIITGFVAGTAATADAIDASVTDSTAAPTSAEGLNPATATANGVAFVLYGVWDADNTLFTVGGANGVDGDAWHATTPDALLHTGNNVLNQTNATGYVLFDDLNQGIVAENMV